MAKQRLCSTCHLPGHTKAAHGKRKKNPEFFTDAHGVHPLRKSYKGKESWGGDYHTSEDAKSRTVAAARRKRAKK